LTVIRALALTALTLLSGCGTYAPDLQDFWQSSETGHVLVQDLVDYVACDVKRSVTQALLDDQRAAPYRIANGAQQGEKLDWLKSRAAQITFTLTVEEKSQLNPGVALNHIYPTAITTFANHPPVTTGQSFAMALAGAYSRQAISFQRAILMKTAYPNQISNSWNGLTTPSWAQKLITALSISRTRLRTRPRRPRKTQSLTK
jgi:hypothetical protein